MLSQYLPFILNFLNPHCGSNKKNENYVKQFVNWAT